MRKSVDPAAVENTPEKRSGRVAFDERGNSVWEWQIHTGVYSKDVNTQSVRTLDLDELSLEDTALRRQLRPNTASPAPLFDKAKAGGGFNPYDNAPPSDGSAPGPHPRARMTAAPVRAKATPSTPPNTTATDPRKPSVWMKLKRALGKD